MPENEKKLHIPDAEELPGDPAAAFASWSAPEEVDTFDEFVRKFWNKELTPEDFRLFRLQNGVYGQSQPDVQMVRVKIPAGGLTADQLDVLAELAAGTKRACAHVTTRQNLQYHFIKLEDATPFLAKVNAAGLTTREACMNTVRTITACHRSGVCQGEAFDVSPYAAAATHFFLRNPLNQSLPRKVKISFSGCSTDCALPLIHDLGAVAKIKDGVRGFEIYLGGGLGAQPRLAHLLEDFTPADDMLVTMASIIRVFDREGDRKQVMTARLKYAVAKLGWENFRELVMKDRARLKLATAGQIDPINVWEERPGAQVQPVDGAAPGEGVDFARWLRTCVQPQKQPEYALVHVRLELGDVTAPQLKTLADVVRRFSNGTVRTTIQQNFAIRWVPKAALPEVFRLLNEAGLAKPGAEKLVDVTSCPGADTCQLGITSSRGMARALTKKLGESEQADLDGVRVKISGCPNSCGQHHIAPIGLFGGAKKNGEHLAPTYQMMLGGSGSAFAKPFLKIPASNVPQAVDRLVALYSKEKKEGEAFGAWVERHGFEALKTELAPLAELPPFEQAPEKYRDMGSPLEEVGSRDSFMIKTGKGECAA